MSGTDPYAQWDAAYVLGALSAAERQEYEEHMAGCLQCREAVGELAGMPGLLGQVPAREVLAMDDPLVEAELPEPPPSLMPSLPPEGARWRRRGWLVPAAAAAAALVVGGLGGYALSGSGVAPARPPAATSTSGPQRLAFSPVVPSSMTAVVDLLPTTAGTRVRVECQYALAGADGYEAEGAWADYVVWVVDRQGRAVRGTTWTAKPDRVMHPTSESPLRPSEISAVEIRRVDTGQTVMRATRT